MCTMIQKEITVLSCFYSHHRVEKQKNKSVCPLSHIHIVVEFRSLAGGRTFLSSLCMAQTGASQAGQIQEKEEEEEVEIWTGSLTTKRYVFCVVSSQQAHHPFITAPFSKRLKIRKEKNDCAKQNIAILQKHE